MSTPPDRQQDLKFPPRTDTQPLSKAEFTCLAMLMSKAFKEFLRLDPDALPDAKANGHTKAQLESSFRHSHCHYATTHPELHPAGPIKGLKEARRGHLECLASHFCKLAGDDLGSFYWSMRDGRAAGRAGKAGDSQSDLRQALAILADEMAKLGYTEAYVAPIIANKFHQRTLGSLTRNEVWQVIYTLRNRAATRDGTAVNNNKSQRKTYAARKAAKARGHGPAEPTPLPRETSAPALEPVGF